MNMNKIFFLLSSITYLQYYIPIIIELKLFNISPIFLYRKNIKKYADPCSPINFKIIKEYCQIYNLDLINSNNFNFKNNIGIFFMIDGDILGPSKEKYIKDSNLFKINSKSIKISLQENLNFVWNYESYINYIDISIFPSKYYESTFKKFSKKNIFIGNTKYDIIKNQSEIFDKYKFNKKNKYVLFFFPKKKFQDYYNIKENDIINIFNHLHKLNYKIIVKTRPKDYIFSDKLKGDIFINEEMLFPNISITLLNLSDFCILFSSSAVEETIKCKVPTIDFHVDLIDNLKRLNFLYHEKTIQHVKNWKNINFDKFKTIHDKLVKKNDKLFNHIIDKYLFSGNISKKILKYLFQNYKIKKIINISDLKSIFKININDFENYYFFIKEIYNLYLKRDPYSNEFYKHINDIKNNKFNEDNLIHYIKNLIH
jgi:hypothetical protein